MKEFVDLLLDNNNIEKYASLIVYALIGLAISLGIEVLRARKRIKRKGGFSFKVWLLDNWLRLIISFLIISVGVLFTPQVTELIGISLEVGNSNGGALVMGFMTDKIIEALINYKNKN